MRKNKLRAISALIAAAMLMSAASGAFAEAGDNGAAPDTAEELVSVTVDAEPEDAGIADEQQDAAQETEDDPEALEPETADELLSIAKVVDPQTDRERIDYALGRLALLNFSEDRAKVTTVSIHLPTTIRTEDDEHVSVEWSSSDEDTLTSSGEILRYNDDGTARYVTLTAVLTSGEESVTKEFPVAIKDHEELKAFPGAQGYGTQTRGGAYGYVCHVTSLAAEGPGSLKEAIETKNGARTIVFDVSGTIDLTPVGRALNLKGENGSNVTIAGQTAPGEGIQLKGYGLTLSNVHDVIVRNISIRIGNVRKAGDTYQSDPLSVSGANKRIVLDHLSFSWAVDMGFRVYGEEITMSNCMISKGMYWNTQHEKGKHNYAGMFGPKYGSFYRNYIADCGQRAPRIIDNEFIDVRNNVISDSKYSFDICNYEWMGANTKYNIVNNMVLRGNPAQGSADEDSDSNSTKTGSYKYFQGRVYSGGLFTYTANNYDNTADARNLSGQTAEIEGGLWQGSLKQNSADEKEVGEELSPFTNSGYSYIDDAWRDMIFPGDMSMDEYDLSLVSKQGNTLVPYPFAAPYIKTYTSGEAAKVVLENAGSRGRFDGDILTRRYLAEGRTRLRVLSDYLKGAKLYGIELPADYAGDTAYGLPVHTETQYIDENGMTVWDIDGNTVSDPAKYQDDPEIKKYVTTADDPDDPTHLNSLYVLNKETGEKYLLKLYDYKDGDDIYDAFDVMTADCEVLEKPNNYGTTANGLEGMHFKHGYVLEWCDWGDGPGNYDHKASTVTDGNIGTDIIDTEWTEYDWPQLPEIYRDGDWDSNSDGIPDFYCELMGWPMTDDDISRLDFEGRGYTNLEYYINDCCAGDMEPEENVDGIPAPAENVRDGSSKFDTHKTHEILFNTVKRAKAKIYLCEGASFDMDSATEISLNEFYDYDVNDIEYTYDEDNEPLQSSYRKASDFDTYFSYVFDGLKPETTYSYKIKTYTDTGIEALSDVTYTFTTRPASTGKPATPRVTRCVPFDEQITVEFEPGSENKTYKQRTYVPTNAQVAEKKTYYITYIGNNSYDTSTDHYILRYSENADMSGAKSVEISPKATGYVIGGLTNGKKYYIDLRAVSADGTESDCAAYNQKEIAETGTTDKDGNPVYSVYGIQAEGSKVVEYYEGYDVAVSTVDFEPTRYTINVDYAKIFEEAGIGEGETTKFTTIFADVYDWYIYTLGGIPIPTTHKDVGKPILMLRDDNHDHGFTYAKKFDTPLDGKSTIHCKLMICDETLDPMNQAPELRFYLQQDNSVDTDATEQEEDEDNADKTTINQSAAFGTIISITFTKNDIKCNGDTISRYEDNVWYDVKLLLDADEGTFDFYLNDKLIRSGLEYADSATSNTIARWQLSSRLAGTEDVYVQYQYAYTGWEVPVTDPDATPAPDKTVKEGTSGAAGGGGGGGGGGAAAATATPEPTDAPDTPQTPEPTDAPVPEFVDMAGYLWAAEPVGELAKRGIINGVSDTEFAPGRDITRAEFAAILMRGFGLIDDDARCSFDDVSEGEWYYSAVASAYELGVITGYSDSEFGTNDSISRQDMAVMTVRLLDIQGIKTEKLRSYIEFSDDDKIADYAKAAIEMLYEAGIIDGTDEGKFEPEGRTIRAAAAKVLYGVLSPQWENGMEE